MRNSFVNYLFIYLFIFSCQQTDQQAGPGFKKGQTGSFESWNHEESDGIHNLYHLPGRVSDMVYFVRDNIRVLDFCDFNVLFRCIRVIIVCMNVEQMPWKWIVVLHCWSHRGLPYFFVLFLFSSCAHSHIGVCSDVLQSLITKRVFNTDLPDGQQMDFHQINTMASMYYFLISYARFCLIGFIGLIGWRCGIHIVS